MKLHNGDCLEIMKDIEDKSVDLILCDLPYGTTNLPWDVIIPFDVLWERYNRIIKDDGIIVLFSSQPFTSKLIMSNLDMYRYNWIWKKPPTGFLNCSYKPLCETEDVCVFSKSTVGSLRKNPIRYNPQGVIRVSKIKRNNPNSTWRTNQGYPSGNNSLNSDRQFIQKYSNYPTNILEFGHDIERLHPTQKLSICSNI